MKKLFIFLLMIIFVSANGQNVKLVRNDAQHKVDVIIGGKLFTSYQYPADKENHSYSRFMHLTVPL